MSERRVACANCGFVFETPGPRAKWCARCEVRARAAQLLRQAARMVETDPPLYHAVQSALRRVAPAGMVSRADYLAGKSTR